MGLISMVLVPFMKQTIPLNTNFAQKQSKSQAEKCVFIMFFVDYPYRKRRLGILTGGRGT